MKIKSIFLILLLAAGLLGCGRQPGLRHIVILPDVSGSIDRKALEQAFKAIDELVGHLQRGDRISIVPILGDAQTEASGRIIRFQVPTNRQAYDADLRRFRVKLQGTLDQMKSDAIAHPGAKTDILGSIVLAEQEFQSQSDCPKRVLVILSDFIQENTELNFKTDQRLASRTAAQEFAGQIAGTSPFELAGTHIHLGLLRSHEYSHLGHGRLQAIQKFWTEYFRTSGAPAEFVIDGPGLLEKIN